VPNLVRVTEDAALPLLNPESVERYAGRCAAGARQKTTSGGVFFYELQV